MKLRFLPDRVYQMITEVIGIFPSIHMTCRDVSVTRGKKRNEFCGFVNVLAPPESML